MFLMNQTPRSTDMALHGGGDTPFQDDFSIKKTEYIEGNLRMYNILDCGILERDEVVMCVQFNPDGKHLGVGMSTGLVKIFSAEKGTLLFTLSDNDTTSVHLPVTSVKFVPVGPDAKIEHKHILMSTYASGMIKFWHYTSGSCLHTIKEGSQVLSSSINPMGTAFVTGGSDASLNLYDMESKTKIQSMEASDSRDIMNGHRSRIFSVQYHPTEPHLFVSGGWDDTVQFWDDRQRHSFRRLYGPHICGDGIDIDATHNHILTASWRKNTTLQIWDFRTAEKIKDVPQDSLHGSLLYCAQWVGKESIICGGCEQNMARVIDRGTLNTVGQLVELPRGVYCLDNDRQGFKPRIAIGAANKVYTLKCEKKQ